MIYNSVSLPTMPTAVASLCALKLAQNPQLRDNLKRSKDHLRARLAAQGIHATDNAVPILTFSMGTPEANQRMFDHLYRDRFLVTLSHYVGAPEEGAIRITLMSSHSVADIDALTAAIVRCKNNN